VTPVDRLTQARHAADQRDFSTAISILRPLAEAGVADAQFELGRLVLTECDLLTGREGFEWLYAAARQGHSEAQFNVATYPSFPSEPFESPLEPTARWELLLGCCSGRRKRCAMPCCRMHCVGGIRRWPPDPR
jgi:hypothetical protein